MPVPPHGVVLVDGLFLLGIGLPADLVVHVALSPAALSTRVRLLEEELGVVLLERTTRHVALTQEGARVHAAAREALDKVAAVRAAAASGADLPFSFTLGTRFEL